MKKNRVINFLDVKPKNPKEQVQMTDYRTFGEGQVFDSAAKRIHHYWKKGTNTIIILDSVDECTKFHKKIKSYGVTQ